MSSLTSKLAHLDRRMLALIAAGSILIVTAATVGGVYAYQQAQPTLTTFNLKDGQKEVPLSQALALNFSRTVDPAAVAAHFHLAPAVEGKLQTATSARTVSWLPAGPYADLTPYTVTLDSFTTGGHTVRGGRWHFVTTIVPRVVSVTTAAGDGVADQADVPVGTKLVFGFNTAMDQPSVNLTANNGPAKLAWAPDGKSATLDTTGMKVGPLALAFAPGGRDTLGHAMAQDWKVTLTLAFKVSTHTYSLKYPALVQVPNDPSARDQSGLQSADIVYEYATEGSIPRLTAIFTNAPDKVGPIRSGRLISIKLTQHYRGELFLSGTSEGTFAVLRQSGINALFDTVGYYYRTADRYPPNNLYTGGDAIARSENQSSQAAYKLKTGKPGIPNGDGGQQVTVAQNGSTYAFDAGTATYTKTEDGHTFADASLGQPLRISMLIVMHTRVTTTSIIEDVNGAHGLDYDLDSGGSAEIYFNGQKANGKWSSPDRNSPLVFTTDSGQSIALPPALVWIDVVP